MIRKSSKLSITIASLSVVGGMALSACGTTTPAATSVVAPPTDTTTMAATAMSTDTTGGVMPTGTAMMSDTAIATGTTMMSGTAMSTSGTGGGTFSGDTIKIGIDLPLSGGDATDGLPTLDGMNLAINQWNAKGGVTIAGKQYKLASDPLDDVPPGGQGHDPAQGSKNADSFISDSSVLVMLGPFNSSVAQAMMPKLNTAGLCSISPSNTNQTLTKPEYGKTGDYRPTGNITYFRTAATDDLQGPAAADYAYDTLKLRKVYVLDDTEAYGKGISDAFEAEFKTKGGMSLGHDGVPKGTTDYSSILTRVAAAGPDFIYYGGTASNNIPLARKQMGAASLNIPLIGGDGIVDAEYIKDAGATALGSYGTVAAVDVNQLASAKQFIADYTAHGFKEAIGAYSGPGYEDANIAIDALSRATAPTRDGECVALRNTKNYNGIMGAMGFDQNGDTTNKWITIYGVKAGTTGIGSDGTNSWQFINQIQFNK